MAKATTSETSQTSETAAEKGNGAGSRTQKCAIKYVFSDGDTSRHSNTGVEVVRFEFANGVSREIRVEELPQNIRDAATAHGVANRLRSSYDNAADADQSVVMFDDTLEDILQGTWIASREGVTGRQVGRLVQAIANVLERHGKAVDLDSIRAKAKEQEDFRKRAFLNPEFAEEYRRLEAEEARAAAEKSGVDSLSVEDFA